MSAYDERVRAARGQKALDQIAIQRELERVLNREGTEWYDENRQRKTELPEHLTRERLFLLVYNMLWDLVFKDEDFYPYPEIEQLLREYGFTDDDLVTIEFLHEE